MSFRLRPTDLCMADAMPFQQHHEARIAGRDLRDVLTPELFLNVRSNLQVGDKVSLCGYSDQTWRRLQQFVEVRITGQSKDGVSFFPEREIMDIAPEPDVPEPPKPEPRLEVVKAFGGGFNVMDKPRNAVLEQFRTKKEAEAWATAHEAR